VQRSIEPEAVALIAFGAIAAVAGLLIAGQAIGRHMRRNRDDLDVLRALGAGPSMTVADGLVGIIGAIVLGALLAGGVAIVLSPLGPIGPVRIVYPSRGVAFDWTVLVGGVAVVIIVLGGLALATAYRSAPHRVARRDRQRTGRTSAAVRRAASMGLPAPAVAGIRFALEAGRGRTAVPARSAIAGTALAVVLVVATVTFGNSLSTLVSRPALYGWDWKYALESVDGYGPITSDAQARLDADPNIEATSGVYFGTADIDGEAVPCLFGSTHAVLAPPILSGRTFDNAGEIVLGAATLASLHKHVGDTVTVSHGTDVAPFQLRVVGTATMPAVGILDGLHSSMGTGALLSADVLPDDARNAFGPFSGPNMVFVRLREGVDNEAAARTVDDAAKANDAALTASPDFPQTGASTYVLPVQRPAEIVNYRSMGNTPPLLAGGLAIGALVALGLTVAAVVGVALGVPLGIALGRWLWILFARQIFAVPQPTVPVLSVGLITVGALVLANVVAALPGRSAARTPTAVLLRAE